MKRRSGSGVGGILLLGALGATTAGCVAGAGAGGGAAGYVISVGMACNPQAQSQNCGMDAGRPAVLVCDVAPRRWVALQTCAGGEVCQFLPGSGGSKLACGTAAGSQEADPTTTPGDDTAAATVDAGTTAANDSGVAAAPDVVPAAIDAASPQDTGSVAPPPNAPELLMNGAIDATLDGKNAHVEFADAEVQVAMVHKLTANAPACVASVQIVAQRAQGTCRLELDFQPGATAGSLDLAQARFFAQKGVYVNGTLTNSLPCDGWVAEPTKGDVPYVSTAGVAGSLQIGPLAQPFAGQSAAALQDVALQATGKVKMAFKARNFVLDLSTLQVQGNFTSVGSADASCAKKVASTPLPSWKLPDIQTKSPGYGQTYGISTFQGKRVVVLMGAGWCASCMAQAAIMEKVRKEFTTAGSSDFQMAVLIDPSQPGPMLTSTNFPAFKGAWSAHKQVLPGGAVHAGAKNDGFAYDYDGRLMGYFQGAGTVYTNYYEDFVRKTLKAPSNGTFFMSCPNAGGSGGCKITP